jgi:hypothetical protein
VAATQTPTDQALFTPRSRKLSKLNKLLKNPMAKHEPGSKLATPEIPGDSVPSTNLKVPSAPVRTQTSATIASQTSGPVLPPNDTPDTSGPGPKDTSNPGQVQFSFSFQTPKDSPVPLTVVTSNEESSTFSEDPRPHGVRVSQSSSKTLYSSSQLLFSKTKPLYSSTDLALASSQTEHIPYSAPQSKITSNHSILPSSLDYKDPYKPFVPITNLSFFNNYNELKYHLTVPEYQVLRYQLYLDIVSQNHADDAVNFAHVRQHSIYNFILRHQISTQSKLEVTPNHSDVRYYEGLLASELLCCRKFIRKLIARGYQNDYNTTNYPRRSSVSEDGDVRRQVNPYQRVDNSLIPALNHEELTQLNIINYVRFLIDLPEQRPKSINEEFETHYKNKAFFIKIAQCLYALKKNETGSTEIISEFLLIQAITKVSYDFILLEKYHIQILTKFNNNFIIDELITKSLFDKYHKGTIPKVLFYNCKYSVQYSWYFAVSIPFIQIFELSIYNEKYGTGRVSHEINVVSDDLATYFNLLELPGYEYYSNLTAKEGIRLVKSVSSPKAHKPINLKFYSSDLASIPDNSLDLIHSRDLMYQLTSKNYKHVISQFHRILVPGGYLDLSWMVLYSQGISNKILNIDLLDYFDMVPNFTREIIKHLGEVFGDSQIKYSIAVLNSKNEVSRFLVNHMGLQLFEVLGKINEYCDLFDDTATEDNMSKLNADNHYYLHIRGQKL